MVENNPDYIASLVRRDRNQRTLPVARANRPQRGLDIDGEMFMENYIRPNFAAVKEYLDGCSAQNKRLIEAQFDTYKAGIGNKILKSANFNELTEEFHKIVSEEVKQECVEFFYKLVVEEGENFTRSEAQQQEEKKNEAQEQFKQVQSQSIENTSAQKKTDKKTA